MYLIFNTQIQDGSFLKSQLGINDYSQLYIGKQTLIQDLKSRIPSFADVQILFCNKPIKTFYDMAVLFDKHLLNYHQLDPNADILYYDLNLFPRDFELFNNVILKSQYSDDLVSFFEKDAEGKKSLLPLFKVKTKDLNKHSNNEQAISIVMHHQLEIDLSKLFIKLDSTQSLLELFSNNFEPRFFNHIKSEQNYFLKSSSKADKMQAEFNFLANIPAELRSYFPQVGEFKNETKTASYQVEKVFMLDLSKQLINKVLNNETTVDALLERLKSYLNLCPSQKLSKEAYQESFRKEILDKNQKRFAELEALPIIDKLNHLAALRGYESAEKVFTAINNALEEHLKNNNEDKLYFSHGDLCFSNILFDKNTSAIKFIDPKGFNTNINETFRTFYYDLAKLSHSFIGLYDLIIYDLVDIQVDAKGDISLQYQIDPAYRELLRTKFEQFIKALKLDYNLVRLIEASLFMSMIPLHQDIPKKMLAQFLQAIDSFESASHPEHAKRA